MKNNTKTRITTSIKTKFKISEEIGPLWSVSHLRESTISELESPSNFQVKEKKLLKSAQIQRNYALI